MLTTHFPITLMQEYAPKRLMADSMNKMKHDFLVRYG